MNRLGKLAQSISKSSWDSVFLKNLEMQKDSGVKKNPYTKSDLVYVCISTTGRAISQVPLMVMQKVSGNKGKVQNELMMMIDPKFVKGGRGSNEVWEPVPDDPWQQVINRPNYLMDQCLFVEALVGHLMLDGNVWSLGFPPTSDVPDSIWVIKRNNIKPVVNNKTGHLEAWSYTPNDSLQTIPIEIEEISHIKFWSPDNNILGQRPLEAGDLPLLGHHKALSYNNAFFDEGAVPGGILSTDKRLSDIVFERTKQQFEGRHKSYKKGHRVAVLEQGLKYTQSGLSHMEMQYIEFIRLTRDSILQLLGMKKTVISITDDINRATAQTQRKEWWTSTNIPIMKKIQIGLNYTYFRNTPNKKLMFDTSSVEALQEEYQEKVKTSRTLFSMGVPFNHLNERLELGFDKLPWGDVGFLPGAMKPITDELLNPLPPVPISDSLENNIPKLLQHNSCIKDTDSIWRNFIASLDPIENKLTSKTSRLFFQMRKKALKLLNSRKILSTKDSQDLLEELFEEEKDWIRRATSPIYTQALTVGQNAVLEEIGAGVAFSMDDPVVTNFLLEKRSKITGVIDTVRQQIQKQLAEGHSQAESIDELAERIKSVFNAATSRAKTISRTEVIGAANLSRAVQIAESGYAKKTWFTALDEKVRPTHEEAHGQTVNIDESFIIGGVSLRFPGDWKGEPQEIINCRCISVADIESGTIF